MELLGPPPAAPQTGIATATPNGGSCVDPLAFAALVERAVAVAGPASGATGAPAEDVPATGEESGPDGPGDTPAPLLGLDVTLLAMLLAGAVPAGAPAPTSQDTVVPTAVPTAVPDPGHRADDHRGGRRARTWRPRGRRTSGRRSCHDRHRPRILGRTPTPPPRRPAASTARPGQPTAASAPPPTAEARPVDPGTVPVVTGGHGLGRARPRRRCGGRGAGHALGARPR